MPAGDFIDFVPLERTPLRLTTAIDLVIGAGSVAVVAAWLVGHPLFYSPSAPVMSPFTALSLLIMVSVRQARLHLETWPMSLSLAMTGLVLGGNVSSILMFAVTPRELWATFPDLVLTSAMTSIGLVVFCAYDLVIALRETPKSAFIVDDLLIHLALVPGALSLLGYLLGNPTYLGVHADPRVGISPLEMMFLGLYATAAIMSNPRLFLWGFLAAGWANRVVFALLFVNHFVAPLVVALVFSNRRTGPRCRSLRHARRCRDDDGVPAAAGTPRQARVRRPRRVIYRRDARLHVLPLDRPSPNGRPLRRPFTTRSHGSRRHLVPGLVVGVRPRLDPCRQVQLAVGSARSSVP